MSEFDLIRRFFTRPSPSAVLGVGDDAALLRLGSGMELAVSTDMLVSGTHFFPDTDPFLLGHKTLAVNLSDMAAMGAQPRWATLALALPEVNETWLQKFSDGFFSLAEQYGVELVGGDTTRGSLNLCVTIMGEVPQGAALRRDGAQVGDDIWVSGKLGDAALALAHLRKEVQLSAENFSACALALHLPQPRVALGLALRDVAHSAIDISDGLLADLGHILQCSRLAAQIQFDLLPLSDALHTLSRADAHPSPARGGGAGLARRCALSGGDDYELCFTAPIVQRAEIKKIAQYLDVPLTCIGSIVANNGVAGSGCVVQAADGSVINNEVSGYDHFC